jgi:hypothetical protein
LRGAPRSSKRTLTGLSGSGRKPMPRQIPHSVVVDDFARPVELVEYYKRWFGPTIAAYESVTGDPDQVAALDRDSSTSPPAGDTAALRVRVSAGRRCKS